MTELLIVLILGFHLLAVNLASLGPLFCIWLGRRGKEDHPGWNRNRDRIGRKLAWYSCWAMLLGMILGGGQLFLSPSTGLLQAIDRLPDRGLWFAALELGFSMVCLLLYAGTWRWLSKHRWCHSSLALLSSSNLLYHFPPLMAILGKLAKEPTWAKTEILDRAALLPLMMRGEVLALSVHFFLASIAATGVAVLWLLSTLKDEDWEQSAQPLSRRAAWAALGATALQLPTGVWLLVSLPKSGMMAMMGDSMFASLTFIGALLLTFLLLQKLLTIAIGTSQPRELRQTFWILVAIVLLMTATLRATRVERHAAGKNNLDKKTATQHVVLHGCRV